MHSNRLNDWQHSHVFGQDQRRAGERRTLFVVALTAAMMLIEIIAGVLYGSMALLADGLHMGSHALALGIAVFAYVISRRSAADRSYSFGVGKINSLAGFASAVLLMGFSLLMVVESTDRLINPLPISFDQALIVAMIGLIVNGASAWILMSTPHEHGHGDGHHHHHGHSHDQHHHDHNLRAAYLHVLADALTSILAIVALLAGKYFGAHWLDPIMGFVGATLVARWSFGLIKDSSRVLLDKQASDEMATELRQSIEGDSSDRIADMHLWSIGHGIFAAEIAIVSDNPGSPAYYKSRIPDNLNIVHAMVEIHRCDEH
ncbi:MAG: CDF family Co(II)/Ni(II) efflux transporter DmeF [Pseudomonadota bacterium]